MNHSEYTINNLVKNIKYTHLRNTSINPVVSFFKLGIIQ